MKQKTKLRFPVKSAELSEGVKKELNDAVEEALNHSILTQVACNPDTNLEEFGQLAEQRINVLFHVTADTEVIVANPLARVPDWVGIEALDRNAVVYRSLTWTKKLLGFKCSADTSTDPLNVRIRLT